MNKRDGFYLTVISILAILFMFALGRALREYTPSQPVEIYE